MQHDHENEILTFEGVLVTSKTFEKANLGFLLVSNTAKGNSVNIISLYSKNILKIQVLQVMSYFETEISDGNKNYKFYQVSPELSPAEFWLFRTLGNPDKSTILIWKLFGKKLPKPALRMDVPFKYVKKPDTRE